MAAPSVAKNQGRVKRKVIALIHNVSGQADKPVGGSSLERSRYWVGTESPNTSAPTGVTVGDLCLDKTNDEVWRYTSSAQWDQMTSDT